MLVAIMHSNIDYLNQIKDIAKEEGFNKSFVFENEDCGKQFIGANANLTLSPGQVTVTYNKAFVTFIDDKQKRDYFLRIVREDSSLQMFNLEEEGFISMLPLDYIKNLGIEPVLELNDQDNEYEFGKVFDENIIRVDIKSQRKSDAIKEVAQGLRKHKNIDNFDLFLSDVFKREAVYSTHVANNIAVPHAYSKGVNDITISLGVSEAGVDFGSSKEGLVKAIILIAIPEKKDLSGYMKILARLSRIIKKPGFTEKILEEYDQNKIEKIFEEVLEL